MAAFRSHLKYSPAALRPQMRHCSPDDLDRPDEVGVDLTADLIVAHLLGCPEETVTGIVHDDIDAPKIGEGAINDLSHRIRIGYVELSFVTKENCRAIQTADLLAFYSRPL